MTDLHSMPVWFGWFMILLGMFLIFPAFAIMLESNSGIVFNAKIEQFGLLYTIGTLFWSYSAWIFLAFIMGIGIKIIRRKDKTTPN